MTNAPKLLSIKAAGVHLGCDDQAASYYTVWEWMHTGKRSNCGHMVVLKSVKLTRRVTTMEWIAEFIEQLADNQPAAPSRPANFRIRATNRPAFDTEATLKKYGLSS